MDSGGQQSTHGAAFADAAADVGTAHVVEAGLDELHGGGQRGGIDGTALARIYNNRIAVEDVLSVVPAVEGQPVVGTDDEHKLMLGVVAGERLQRVPRIAGARQVELVVAGHEARLVGQGLACELEARLVVEQVGAGLLEGVQRRHEKPHLVEVGLAEHLPCQGDVAAVDGVEGTTVDANLLPLPKGGEFSCSCC